MSLAWQLQRPANTLDLAAAMTQYIRAFASLLVHSNIESGDMSHALRIESQRACKVGDSRRRSGKRSALRKLPGRVARATPVSAEVHLAFRIDCKSKRTAVSRCLFR